MHNIIHSLLSQKRQVFRSCYYCTGLAIVFKIRHYKMQKSKFEVNHANHF